MQILLVNTNPVVSRLISLAMRSHSSDIHVDEVRAYEVFPKEWYDLLLIDENCCSREKLEEIVHQAGFGKRILFSAQAETNITGIDTVVTKPFLPSDISRVIESTSEDLSADLSKEWDTESVIMDEHMSMEPPETANGERIVAEEENSVLDRNEIEKIKQILAGEGPEVAENEESDMESEVIIPEETEKKKPKKKKKKTMLQKTKEEEAKFEKKLLKALIAMKPKKIKKLLKDAEVSISIRFPKGK